MSNNPVGLLKISLNKHKSDLRLGNAAKCLFLGQVGLLSGWSEDLLKVRETSFSVCVGGHLCPVVHTLTD